MTIHSEQLSAVFAWVRERPWTFVPGYKGSSRLWFEDPRTKQSIIFKRYLRWDRNEDPLCPFRYVARSEDGSIEVIGERFSADGWLIKMGLI